MLEKKILRNIMGQNCEAGESINESRTGRHTGGGGHSKGNQSTAVTFKVKEKML